MSHIRVYLERPKGRKQWRLRWTDHQGREHREGTKCVRKRDAEPIRSAKEAAVNRGEVSATPPARLTLADAIAFDNAHSPQSPRTMRQRRSALRRLVEVCGGTVAEETGEVRCTYLIRKVSERHIADVKRALDALASNSRTVYLRHLSAFFNRARRRGWVGVNPVGSSGELEPTRHRTYSADEVRAMIDAAPNEWWRIFVLTLVNTSLRLNEALHLRWEDVALEAEAAEIRVQPAKAGWVEVGAREYPLLPWQAKNRHSYREIPLPSHLVEALARWKAAGGGRSPYVFIGLDRLGRLAARARVGKYPGGDPVNSIHERFRRLQQDAARLLAQRRGVPTVDWARGTPHDLRRTFVDVLKRAGISFDVIARCAGHRVEGVLGRHYTQLTAQDRVRVVRALEAEAGVEVYGTFTAHSAAATG
jgi:integrase